MRERERKRERDTQRNKRTKRRQSFLDAYSLLINAKKKKKKRKSFAYPFVKFVRRNSSTRRTLTCTRMGELCTRDTDPKNTRND